MDKNWPAHALVSMNVNVYLHIYVNIECCDHTATSLNKSQGLCSFHIYKIKTKNCHVIFNLFTHGNTEDIFYHWRHKQHCPGTVWGSSCNTHWGPASLTSHSQNRSLKKHHDNEWDAVRFWFFCEGRAWCVTVTSYPHACAVPVL